MAKTIRTQTQITSLRALTDGSLSLTVHSPELTSKQKAAFMDLQNVICDTTFKPEELSSDKILRVNKSKDTRSASERLLKTLYAYWATRKDRGDDVEDFDQYYRKFMGKIISNLQIKLDELK